MSGVHRGVSRAAVSIGQGIFPLDAQTKPFQRQFGSSACEAPSSAGACSGCSTRSPGPACRASSFPRRCLRRRGRPHRRCMSRARHDLMDPPRCWRSFFLGPLGWSPASFYCHRAAWERSHGHIVRHPRFLLLPVRTGGDLDGGGRSRPFPAKQPWRTRLMPSSLSGR